MISKEVPCGGSPLTPTLSAEGRGDARFEPSLFIAPMALPNTDNQLSEKPLEKWFGFLHLCLRYGVIAA
jgi:hypothetical protein